MQPFEILLSDPSLPQRSCEYEYDYAISVIAFGVNQLSLLSDIVVNFPDVRWMGPLSIISLILIAMAIRRT